MNARNEAEGLKYGFVENAKAAETLELSAPSLGQRNPQHCPHLPEPNAMPSTSASSSPLGAPMNISEVAEFLGCSAWTVRQRYLPQGLPHLRACGTGKLVFFREQVASWILKRQQQRQKGGNIR
jgi:hypothetical protein